MADAFDPYHTWLGISAKEQPPHHYRLLGLELYESSPEVIEHAADRQMAHLKSLHAGKHAAVGQRILNELAAAKICLLNPEKRASYDRQLRTRLEKPAMPPLPMAQPLTAAPSPKLPVAALLPATFPAQASPGYPRVRKQAPAGLLTTLLNQPLWMKLSAAVGLAAVILIIVMLITSGDGDPNSPSDKKIVQTADKTLPDKTQPGKSPPIETLPNNTLPNKNPSVASDTHGTETSTPNPTPDPAISSPDKGVENSRPIIEPPSNKPPDAVAQNGLRPGRPIDLLKKIDPQRDAVQGDWQFDGPVLIVPGHKRDRLAIPVAVPEEYILVVVAERKSGRNDLGLGLIVGGVQTMLGLDGNRGKHSGIDVMDGKNRDENETHFTGATFVNGRPGEVVCIVRKSSLKVICNGATRIDWQGDPHRLSFRQEFAVPDTTRLFLMGWDSSFAISRLDLYPIGSGEPPPGTLAAANSTGPAPTDPSKHDVSATPAVKEPDQPALPVQRLPLPEEAKRQEAEKLVREVFAKEIAAAKKSAEKVALADFLEKQGNDTSDDPNARFVLWSLARDLALEGGDPAAALRRVDLLVAMYDLDPVDARTHVLTKAIETTIAPPALSSIVSLILPLIEAQVADDNYDGALKFTKLGLEAANKSHDVKLIKQVKDQIKELNAAKGELVQVQAALEQLKTTPDDAQANLLVGRWLWFTKNDPQAALPHLAKSEDSTLLPVIEKDLAASKSTPGSERTMAQIAAGDAWYDVGQAAAEPAKSHYLTRAGTWYMQAAPESTGLTKVKVDKRIAELRPLLDRQPTIKIENSPRPTTSPKK